MKKKFEKIIENDAGESRVNLGKLPESPSTATEKMLMPIEMQMVVPAVAPEIALKAWRDYLTMKRMLLDSSDYQSITTFQTGKGTTKRSFIKKSGWRKLATAFNLSDEIIKEERKEYNLGQVNYYFVIEVTAKVTAKNGRISTAIGSCASNERKFAHTEHDVRSTAHTRAKNRAISDMIGGGEVSAEEVERASQSTQQKCNVNHDALEIKTVVKEGKNKGKKYMKCPNCPFWQWVEQDITDQTTPKANEPSTDQPKA